MDKAPEAFRTISEVAEELDVPQHVLRFWESRFAQIKPMKRGGGRRYYRPDDIDLLRGIRHLLYGEGYTIRGVQRILKEQGVKFVQVVWQEGAPQPSHGPGDDSDIEIDTNDERGRGIFGLLPSFLAHDEPSGESEDADSDSLDEAEEGAHRPHGHSSGAAHRSGALAPQDMERLQNTMRELVECKRLLDDAMGEGA